MELKDKESLAQKKYELKCLEADEQEQAKADVIALNGTIQSLEAKIGVEKKEKEELNEFIKKLQKNITS